jgi:hypothetical protein
VGISLFEVKTIPGKGRGLVTCSDIVKGTRILAEKSLFTLASPSHWIKTNIHLIKSIVMAKVRTLPKEQQRQYLSLHNNYPGTNSFCGIFRTNALPCGAGSIVGAICPTICLLNHACDPNSHHSWNSATNIEAIQALRDMKAGEEITISYNRDETSSVRRAKLRSSFRFDCACDLCSLPPAETQQSGARRLRSEQVYDATSNPASVMNTPVCFPCLRIPPGSTILFCFDAMC